MGFWGVEVKYGDPQKIMPGLDMILHLSQAYLIEAKKENRDESVSLFVNVDGKKFALATLFTKKLPQQQFKNVVFDRDFELSHNWKNGSVFFYGHKAKNSLIANGSVFFFYGYKAKNPLIATGGPLEEESAEPEPKSDAGNEKEKIVELMSMDDFMDEDDVGKQEVKTVESSSEDDYDGMSVDVFEETPAKVKTLYIVLKKQAVKSATKKLKRPHKAKVGTLFRRTVFKGSRRLILRPMMYDMKLTLDWGPSRGVNILRFFIHGGWPERKGKKKQRPTKFRTKAFRRFPVKLQKRMQRYWPNLKKNSKNIKFWNHEWRKHGFWSGMKSVEFFFTVVELYKKVPKFKEWGLEVDKPVMIGEIRKTMEQKFHGADIHGIKLDQLYIVDARFMVQKNLAFVNAKRSFSKPIKGKKDLVVLPGQPIIYP